jgi:hypothetical protein
MECGKGVVTAPKDRRTQAEHILASLLGGLGAGVFVVGLVSLLERRGILDLSLNTIWLIIGAATVFGLYCGIDYRRLAWKTRGGAWIGVLVAIRELACVAFLPLAPLLVKSHYIFDRLEILVWFVAGALGERAGRLGIKCLLLRSSFLKNRIG